MLSSKIFIQVLLPLALDESFTYFCEEKIAVGDVVLVEFGRKKIWGVVVAVDVSPQFAAEKIKAVLEKHKIKLSEKQLEFIEKIAAYNLASRGLVLRAFIGILNSDKVKKEVQGYVQEVDCSKFVLKELSKEQQKIVDKISHASSVTLSLSKDVLHAESKHTLRQAQDDTEGLRGDNERLVTLLDGVTGSGKTEIYFAIIAKILAQNSNAQILILLPEIALTSQLLMRFEEQFGFKVALWHSKISKKEKREIFYGIVNGTVRVLIGARSALLLPFKNLQLIVVDEEHDPSFKQEDVFNFNARDMAILKGRIENFLVILSSATPSLETYVNALSGKYQHFILDQKFSSAKKEISLIDLRQEKLPKEEFLSEKLRAEIAKTLAVKKQVLLFLNRRGYAPVTLCKACGKKYECSNCDFNLVLHKAKNQLTCHHCGHQEKILENCKFCGEENSLISLGIGVEKLHEEVARIFPEARTALITSDNVSNFLEAQKIVKQILNHEIDIIIGTQMIVKGYDFPGLTLVGIVDFDAMLYSSSLRSLEKTYQILTQVIGRAGRRADDSKVIIQTYNPQNLIFEKIINNSKKDFYDFEIKNRKHAEFPPFARMAKFEISAFQESEAKNFAKKLMQHFPFDEKITIFGPAPAPLQRLKNRHHFLLNLKTAKKVNLQKLIADVMKNIEIPNSIRIRIDVDPTE